MCDMHVIKYSALERKEFWNNNDESWGHYAKWNQSQKDKYCMIWIYKVCKKSQIHRIKVFPTQFCYEPKTALKLSLLI